MAAIVTQEELRRLVSEKAPTCLRFVKNTPFAVYRLSVESMARLPESIFGVLGAVDKATYGDTPAEVRHFLLNQGGGAIALQFNGDEPDFYPISHRTYAESYSACPVCDLDPALGDKLRAFLGDDWVSNPYVEAVRKMKPVEMFRAVDLGIAPGDELVIEATWGGTQTKEPGKDVYLARDGEGLYMIQYDAAGLPIGYVPLPVA